MKLCDFTLNNVTMLALGSDGRRSYRRCYRRLGNVFRCIEEEGMDPFQASITGTRARLAWQCSRPPFPGVIVFLPVSFLSSVYGRMLFQFGVTATVAIMVSMFVSFTLTPMMCSRLLKSVPKGQAGQHAPDHAAGFTVGLSGSICGR